MSLSFCTFAINYLDLNARFYIYSRLNYWDIPNFKEFFYPDFLLSMTLLLDLLTLY